ncbi:ABC transporter substrate-binding protein [Marinivivus vitaminiproducens]|uniref:ABC transporter substrate-binding protein n=1 Tax=Marinivivus vitaminiproducens TaxID=3035935 RepID=UPI0027A31E79|nr:ABC transporter substrate-binding protein [Geminicoccaceae bacterium SCSIO 64248]
MRQATAFVATGVLLLSVAVAHAAETVRVGEINSYSRIPSFTESYRKGWQLAVEQVNARGGVQIEVVSRDDNGEPSTAVALANELLLREQVDLLAGTFLSNIGLAISELARQRKVFFLAAEPLSTQLTWEKGNRYTWRLRPSTWMQNKALAEEAAKLPAQRWAVIAPNYEYGQSAVAEFKRLLSELKPEVEFVAEQWPAQGRLDAGPTVQALLQARPDAIYNATFATDLVRFVREGRLRGLFDGRDVVSLITGEPEYLDPLGAEAPEGWIVTGYPWSQIDLPEHTAFLRAFEERWHEPPKLGAVVGYTMIETIAAAVEKAGTTNTDPMLQAMAGLELSSPFGPIVWRGIDHQATLGAFVGKLGVVDGKPTMVDWRYADGALYQPSDEEVRKLRPQDDD